MMSSSLSRSLMMICSFESGVPGSETSKTCRAEGSGGHDWESLVYDVMEEGHFISTHHPLTCLSPSFLLATQAVFFLRTFPSWPQCAPNPASSPFCYLFIMNRESSSSVWRLDAHLSSCMRIRMASQPRTTTLCSVLSTLLTESTSNLKYLLLYMT